MTCTTYCVIPRSCTTIPIIPEIDLWFNERYSFQIAFSSVEDDVYFGRDVDGSCYVEIYDVGDTDLFQIGDPFFKEYYTVFSANNSTMGFGLSVERNGFTDDPVINDTTPNEPAPQAIPEPLPELEPIPAAPTGTYPSKMNPTAPDGHDENVVTLATVVTAGGALIFFIVVIIYYFFIREEHVIEESGKFDPPVAAGDGRVRL